VALLVSGQAVIHGLLSVLAGHGAAHGAGHDSGHGSGFGAGRAREAAFAFDGRQVERTGSYFDQVAAMQVPSSGGASVESAASTGSGAAGWSHLVEHLGAQSPAMLLAHLLVVALLGVWLAVGERALWAVLTLTMGSVLDVVGSLLSLDSGRFVVLLLERVRRTPALRSLSRDAVPLPHLLHHVVAHRGPPALLAS
jgi:hypothetical protein